MATNVYTLHVAYEGLEKRIWRDIEVSGNYTLDRLGYVILTSFDTLAYHLFEFNIDDCRYVIPHAESQDDVLDMAKHKLCRLNLELGDKFVMDYDYGTTQTFLLEVTGIREMEKHKGRSYPRIIAGEGLGIIDDMASYELAELIKQIDANGKTDEEIYYDNAAVPWNFQAYDMELDNYFLKDEVAMLQAAYSPLWDEEW